MTFHHVRLLLLGADLAEVAASSRIRTAVAETALISDGSTRTL